MNWFEKSAVGILKHRLPSTYQMAIMTELILILSSFVAEVGKLNETTIFFAVLAFICFLRLVYLYAVLSREKELKVIYAILILVQAGVSLVLYFTASIFLFLCVTLFMIVILPVLTHKLCQKMSVLE